MLPPWQELIPADMLFRLILKEVEDYVPVNNEEESAMMNKVLQEDPKNPVNEQLRNKDLRRLIRMMELWVQVLQWRGEPCI